MRVAIVNHVWDPRAPTPEETLDRFSTLTGWAEAVQAAGGAVQVFQRFRQDAGLVRGGVAYMFRADAHPPRPPAAIRRLDALHRAAAESMPDLVHVNGFEYPLLLRHLRRTLAPSAALVAQDHGGFDPHQASALRRAWLRRGIGALDALLVSSPGHVEAFRHSRLVAAGVGLFDVMESSSTLAPVACDAARAASGLDGSPAILWVGRLNANKDPLTVVRGFAMFAATRRSATLGFVYPAPTGLEERVRAEARALGVAPRVRLIGRVPHGAIASFYSAADLFVIGSNHEGSGYAVIEAIACGAVPVVTDIASFRTLTRDGSIGALWRPGDPRSLCAALEQVAARPLDAQRAAARALFQREFSWTAIGSRAMEIYGRVVGRRRPG